MSILLIDTSALHALNYARDDNHIQAVTYFKSLTGRVKPILTEWVFVETMNLTRVRLGPRYAIEFGRQLKASKAFYHLILSDIDKRTTWDIFETYDDKAWSYVDCSLLAVARRLKLRRIFAFDHHFVQMGLEVFPLGN
jgi:predicted nucleic acid-binding protein